jgi:hypothetical protein
MTSAGTAPRTRLNRIPSPRREKVSVRASSQLRRSYRVVAGHCRHQKRPTSQQYTSPARRSNLSRPAPLAMIEARVAATRQGEATSSPAAPLAIIDVPSRRPAETVVASHCRRLNAYMAATHQPGKAKQPLANCAPRHDRSPRSCYAAGRSNSSPALRAPVSSRAKNSGTSTDARGTTAGRLTPER